MLLVEHTVRTGSHGWADATSSWLQRGTALCAAPDWTLVITLLRSECASSCWPVPMNTPVLVVAIEMTSKLASRADHKFRRKSVGHSFTSNLKCRFNAIFAQDPSKTIGKYLFCFAHPRLTFPVLFEFTFQ